MLGHNILVGFDASWRDTVSLSNQLLQTFIWNLTLGPFNTDPRAFVFVLYFKVGFITEYCQCNCIVLPLQAVIIQIEGFAVKHSNDLLAYRTRNGNRNKTVLTTSIKETATFR